MDFEDLHRYLAQASHWEHQREGVELDRLKRSTRQRRWKQKGHVAAKKVIPRLFSAPGGFEQKREARDLNALSIQVRIADPPSLRDITLYVNHV